MAYLGLEQPCEDVFGTVDGIYKRYVTDMHDESAKIVNGPAWRQQQIAVAQPIVGMMMSAGPDHFIGTELHNQSYEGMGSVYDIVLSPTTGTIAYLIIGCGGIFGLDKAYVLVRWGDIRATPNMKMLVLDSTKSAMDDAPRVPKNQFFTPKQYAETAQKVDDYWKVHIVRKVGD